MKTLLVILALLSLWVFTGCGDGPTYGEKLQADQNKQAARINARCADRGGIRKVTQPDDFRVLCMDRTIHFVVR